MATLAASEAPPALAPRSPWHSPVPYLFGGLAAMLGLIAFALLILACSYRKFANHENRDEGQRDLEAAEEDGGAVSAPPPPPPPALEEKYLVIMAGEEKPTFLATPISSRASSFGSKSTVCTCSSSENTMLSEEDFEKKQNEIGNEAALDQVH